MNDWISIRDKLPDKDGWYLISMGNEWDGNNLGKVNPEKKIYPSNVRISKFYNGQFYHGMVAAWMPIPEPFRGE